MQKISLWTRYLLSVAVIVALSACGGGPDEIPVPTISQPLPVTSSSQVELEVGKPFANPSLIPPSAIETSVTFRSKISGYQTPPEVIMLDELDTDGNVLTENIAQLYDDGEGVDSYLGDRTYSGSIKIGSESATSIRYRARAIVAGETTTSSALQYWISGCPVDARPSDESKLIEWDTGVEIYANEVLVILDQSTAPSLENVNTIAATVSGTVVGCVPELNQFLFEFAGETVADVETAIASLAMRSDVVDALPNVKLSVSDQSGAGTCDENCEWYLEKIRAPEAWLMAGAGDEEFAIGVLDFGVDCTHDELPCDETLYNSDIVDHGTGVASLIFARDDGNTVTGASWNTTIYPRNFLGEGGSVHKMSELISASLNDENVKVINISAGSPLDPSGQILDSVCNAIASGRLVVAAAGNAPYPSCELENIYPAAYNSNGAECENGADLQKGLLVVGATDTDNNLAEWEISGSGVCSNTLHADIFAPGENVFTAGTGNTFVTRNGTSFATPLVSATAAVLWASNPELTVAELHDQILEGAAEMSSGSTNPRAVSTSEIMQGKLLLDMFSILGGEDIGGELPDFVPDSFVVSQKTSAALGGDATSERIVISGLDLATAIDVEGGFYAIDDGAFTSAAGQISNGQTLRIRVKASQEKNTTTQARVTIGGVEQVFEVTTGNGETNLEDLAFPNQQNVEVGDLVESTEVIITEISQSTPISVAGGSYSLNGGAYTTTAGTINPGDTLRIAVDTSESSYGDQLEALVTINNIQKSFKVKTIPQDIKPNAFMFATPTPAPTNTVIQQNVDVSGINSPTYISISGEGAQYSINGGEFVNDIGVVQPGQQVTVRLSTPARFGVKRYATLNIGGVSSTLTAVSVAEDTTPDDIRFVPLLDVDPDTPQTSETLAITGINGPTPISVENGLYSLDGGAFTDVAGTILADQTVAVQVQSSAEFGNEASATLNIGTSAFDFTVVTSEEDLQADDFSFSELSDVALSSTQQSDIVTITGINTSVPLSIENGSYSIDGGAFTSVDGTIENGQTLQLQVTAAATFSTRAIASVSVGSLVQDFAVTTLAADTSPDAFDFTDVTNAPVNTAQASDAVVISGINSDAPITIENGLYSIDGGAFTAATGTIQAGQTMQLQVQSSTEFGTATSVVVMIGDVQADFTVTTEAEDNTPDTFAFLAVENAQANTSVFSNTVTITGINTAAAISIVNGTYSIDGGAFTDVAGTIEQGQSLQLQMVSDAGFEVEVSATVSVGSVDAVFSVTTEAEDTVPDAFSFIDQEDLPLAATVESDIVTVSGINSAAVISVTNGSYSINEGPFTTADGTVIDGDEVQIQLVTSTAYDSAETATLTIGGVTGTFTARTEDGVPRVSGLAYYLDNNRDGLVNENDEIMLPFDREVNASAADENAIAMPVTGDSIGAEAFVQSSARSTFAQIILGLSPNLTIANDFSASFLDPGSPSGIDVSGVAGAIVSEESGQTAEPLDTPVDIAPGIVPYPTNSPMPSEGTTENILADLNGDPVPEFITVSPSQTTVFRNAGQGSFSSSFTLPGTASVAVGELDPNFAGREIVIDLDSLITIYADTPDGYLDTLEIDSGFSSILDIKVGLMDEDALADIVVLGSDGLTVFYQQVDGSFDPFALSAIVAEQIDLVDYDGNGTLDILAINSSSVAESVIYINVIDSFALNNFDLGLELGSYDWGDVNNDGRADIILNQVNGPTRLFINESLGNFEELDISDVFDDINTSYALKLVDMDGNLTLDVVRLTLDLVERDMIYFNDGSGVFTPSPQQLNVGSVREAMTIGDLDGDGDFDFILSPSEFGGADHLLYGNSASNSGVWIDTLPLADE